MGDRLLYANEMDEGWELDLAFMEDTRDEMRVALEMIRAEAKAQVERFEGILRKVDERIDRLYEFAAPSPVWYEGNRELRPVGAEAPLPAVRLPSGPRRETNADVIIGFVAGRHPEPVSLRELRDHLESIGHRLAKAANPAKAISNEVASMRDRGYLDRLPDGRVIMSPRAIFAAQAHMRDARRLAKQTDLRTDLDGATIEPQTKPTKHALLPESSPENEEARH